MNDESNANNDQVCRDLAVDDNTLVKQQLCPLISKHTVFPLLKQRDPTFTISVNKILIQILLDSGSHVSVMPKSILDKVTNGSIASGPKRPIRIFGGQEIELEGPVQLDVDICGVKLTHPFYYVDSDVPAIAGYDIMVAARIVLDPHSRVVWSTHPSVVQRAVCSVIPNSDSDSSVQSVVSSTGMSPASEGSKETSDFCATEGTFTSLSTEYRFPQFLNPSVPAFAPENCQSGNLNIADDMQTMTGDDLPTHLNLLYETTVNNTRLSSTVDKQFRELLRNHESTFAKDSTDLGFCDAIYHDIDTGDSPPIKQQPRRPPLSAGDAENTIIDEMLTAGVIEPSKSEWASPVCLVKKPDRSYRFCVDYRRVNAVSRKDGFPIPDIQDALDSLRGARWFATLDMLSGYWQLPMTDRAKDRSAFCTRRGLFHFVRMPFGLSGAPATFCRLMTNVLGDLLWKICLCYIDDVILYAKTQQELLDRLDTVLTRLRQYGLKVKPSKCVLFRTEISFLGHLVNANGVQPLPEKVIAIKDWPVPRCIKDVRAFYGLVGYYRKFIPSFATIAEPLTRLTKKNVKFCWSEEADSAFRKLKQALLDTPTLTFPYPDRPVIVDTDSSDVAYGCVISQMVDGHEKPIAYFSRVMTPAQQNYCATRRELLAVIASLQHFRHYLLNVPVILRTDHSSLKWLQTFKKPEGILARWLETLAEFQINIQHRPGRVHSNADALSRQQCKQCWGKTPEHTYVDELDRANDCTAPLGLHALQLLPELSTDTILDLQQQDPIIRPVTQMLQSQVIPTTDDLRQLPPEARTLWGISNSLKQVSGVLVRLTDTGGTQLVVPETLKRRIFEQAHAGPLGAHLGVDRTVSQIKLNYYWPGMNKDVRLWQAACEVCARGRGPPNRPHATMTKVMASAPMDLVAVDILSGLPTTQDGSNCLLVAVDYFTKWVEAYPLANEEAATCMTALYNNFFSRFGLPSQLHSDQGRNFESKLVTELTKITGIRKTRTTPFHPRSDGQTERFNRTMLAMLRAVAYDSPTDWPARVPAILAAYRMTPHKTTGVTPNLTMLGREVQCPCTLIAAPPDEPTDTKVPYVQEFRQNLREAHERVRQTTQKSAKVQKNYFDARAKTISFHKNQYVWLYWPKPSNRQKYRKLEHLWTGPYKIIDFLSEVVVKIQNIRNNKTQTVHVDRLTPCSAITQIDSGIKSTLPHSTMRDVNQQHQMVTASRNQAAPNSFASSLPTRRSTRTIKRPSRYSDH